MISAKKGYDGYLLSMAEKSGVRAISLYDAFLNYSGAEKLYFDHDMHFTAFGHERDVSASWRAG